MVKQLSRKLRRTFPVALPNPTGDDLGFFGKNMMVKEGETVAVSVKSESVKTQFGWHRIKVYDKK